MMAAERKRNPFKPGLGTKPPTILGRENLLEDFEDGIEDGAGSPGLSVLITGPRGIGKTVLLNEAGRIAETYNWITVSETVLTGGKLMNRLYGKISLLNQNKVWETLSSINLQILGTGGGFQKNPHAATSLEQEIIKLTHKLAEKNSGIVLLVDEIQRTTQEERENLAAILQRLTSADLPVGLVMAGLPGAIQSLIEDKAATSFMRRAVQIFLNPVEINTVVQDYANIFGVNDIPLTPPLITKMAQASVGYPTLVQLIGHRVWKNYMKQPGQPISHIVDTGIEDALDYLKRQVLQAEIKQLSPAKLRFLKAMALSTEPIVPVSFIAEKLGAKAAKNLPTYRQRLIQEGIINAVGYGEIKFVLPYLQDYLREETLALPANPTLKQIEA